MHAQVGLLLIDWLVFSNFLWMHHDAIPSRSSYSLIPLLTHYSARHVLTLSWQHREWRRGMRLMVIVVVMMT